MVSWADFAAGAIAGFTLAAWLGYRAHVALLEELEELRDAHLERVLLSPPPASAARDAADRPVA